MKKTESVEDKILRSARKIFAAKGRRNATMAEIAADAGISRTLLNYYFRSKDKLFQGVFEGFSENILPDIQKAIEENSSVLEKFGRIIDVYTDMLIRNPDMPLFILNEIQSEPDCIFDAAKQIPHFSELLAKFARRIEGEMNYGSINKMPLVDILTVYFGMVIFPFAAKNVICKMFFSDSEKEFDAYVLRRKKLVLGVIKNLLTGRNNDFSK